MPRSKLAKLLLEEQSQVETGTDNAYNITKFGVEQLTNLMSTLQDQLHTWDPNLTNYNPLFEIAKIAFLSDSEAIKLKAHSEIAKYGYPQVRSLEVQAKQDKNITLKIELADYARSRTLDSAEIEEIEAEDVDEAGRDAMESYNEMVMRQATTEGRKL